MHICTRIAPALACLAAVLLIGCTTPSHATAPPTDSYILVVLRKGSSTTPRTDAERQAIQAVPHLANIGRLAHEGVLVVAGPFGKVNHDPSQRGLFILDVRTIEQASALVASDPSVQAGLLAADLSFLETSADLRGALQAELAADADAKRAGRERPIETTIRPYVLVRAVQGAVVGEVLEAAVPAGRMVIDGRINCAQGFFVIDSRNVDEVRGWLGEKIDDFGVITFDEWYASALLVDARR